MDVALVIDAEGRQMDSSCSGGLAFADSDIVVDQVRADG
jgi:hypothetical protein